jgi:DNA polymerase-3 subunit delta'
MATRWLAERKVPDAAALLAFSGGMPLAAAEMAEGGAAAARKRFVDDIASLPRKAPLRLAGEWESWLKSKDAAACGFDMPTLVGWLQRWVADLVSLRLGGPVRFFPAQYDILHSLSGRLSIDSALGCYNEITQSRRVSQHPLNARLFLEDMLLRYARSLQAAAPAMRR